VGLRHRFHGYRPNLPQSLFSSKALWSRIESHDTVTATGTISDFRKHKVGVACDIDFAQGLISFHLILCA
jgi:hypothetical protein